VTRLTDLPPDQAKRLAELECPNFATRRWVTGPTLRQRRVARCSPEKPGQLLSIVRPCAVWNGDDPKHGNSVRNLLRGLHHELPEPRIHERYSLGRTARCNRRAGLLLAGTVGAAERCWQRPQGG